MRFSCDSKAMSSALFTVQAAAPTRSVQPILMNVYIAAAENVLLSATDLETSIDCVIDGKVEDVGQCVLPIDKLSAILKELSGSVTFAAENSVVSILCNGTRFSLPTEDPERYPLDENEFNPDCEISGPTLATMLGKIRPVITRKDGRYNSGIQMATSGVMWCCSNGELEISACDLKRVAVVKKIGDFPDMSEKILTRKAISSIVKMATENEVVKFAFSDRQVVVQAGNTTLISRLLEGKFPPYKSVWPKSAAHKIIVPEGLLSAVRKAKIVASLEDFTAKIEFDGESIKVSASGSGEAESTVPAKSSYVGQIRIDPDAVIDILNHTEGEVEMLINDDWNPVVFDNGDFQCMAMLKVSHERLAEIKKRKKT